MASHPCLTDIRRTLYEDSAAINRLRGRPRGARTRYHGPKALQIRQDRRLAPGPARIPFRGEGDPCEGADVLDTARRPADGPEGEGERKEYEEDREAEGKARRLDLEEHLELRAEACGGRHQSSATR